MTQEEKQLLLKDLCARLPYGVKCRMLKLDSQVCTLNSGLLDKIEILEPYLRPMSSMTEEEMKEFNAFHCLSERHPITIVEMCNLNNELNMFNWLNKKHFDYRGLIPMGLALEAPENMYNTRTE